MGLAWGHRGGIGLYAPPMFSSWNIQLNRTPAIISAGRLTALPLRWPVPWHDGSFHTHSTTSSASLLVIATGVVTTTSLLLISPAALSCASCGLLAIKHSHSAHIAKGKTHQTSKCNASLLGHLRFSNQHPPPLPCMLLYVSLSTALSYLAPR